MVKAVPATVIVPVLSGPSLGATLKVTVPFPVPEAPAVIVIQESSATAVHGQAAEVATWKVRPEAPATGTDALDGLRVVPAVQESACVMVNVFPPAVIVPDLSGPAFAATL